MSKPPNQQRHSSQGRSVSMIPASSDCIKQQIREETSIWHFLFENSHDAIVLLNMKGEVVDANDAFARHLKYSREELYDLHLWDWEADLPEDELLKLLPSVDQAGVVFESRHRLKDNTTVHVEIASNATFFQDERMLLCICRDATKKKLHDETMQKLISTDALTNLANRREFTYRLNDSLHSVRQGKPPFSLLLLDVDNFKGINDQHGHLFGDQVLIDLSNKMDQLVPGTSLLSRWGGEEFTILMPATDTSAATAFAEQLRAGIAQQLVCDIIYVTVSIGVTTWCPNDDLNSMFKRADDAMYSAKRSGRNCIKTILGA
ncbi:hypothetical protein DN730_06360 [Marinomonas piezotolerans]|uniref:diguanylate cyclase n=1 Tax=Marinomonas piezotolerans TaxID=2213058 RepID=A0A370UBW1_9GAMM|nr:sensor domain-containing diguanylate cyclase [Marinomonas piezotolerans]RDL45229.1 hypothetical protein DN730_06360 [Marinomonas piezotolerans]